LREIAKSLGRGPRDKEERGRSARFGADVKDRLLAACDRHYSAPRTPTRAAENISSMSWKLRRLCRHLRSCDPVGMLRKARNAPPAMSDASDAARPARRSALQDRFGSAYKVLALQVELCLPRLIASCAEPRWRLLGFQPGSGRRASPASLPLGAAFRAFSSSSRSSERCLPGS